MSILKVRFIRVFRSQKVAGTMQALMGGHEVYHYHSKLMIKDSKTGGAFEWHQDYGYWYINHWQPGIIGGNLFSFDPT